MDRGEKPVVGIGQCSYDYVALVDEFLKPDEKYEATDMYEQAGGPVATALMTLSVLGWKTRFHGVTGTDPAGELIEQALCARGVDVHTVRREGASQTALIIVEPESGHRTIVWKRPGGKPLQPGELGEGFLDGAFLLHLDGLMPEASLYAARLARERGVPVVLDAGRMREGMIELASLSNHVVASERFAVDVGLGGALDSSESFQRVARGKFDASFTVTLGSRGSYSLINDEVIYQPAFEVEAVDTTGAGDVFHAGYIHGVLSEWDIGRTLQFAAALAAMKCEKNGNSVEPDTGLSLAETVESFMKRH